jgi:hypothetical protein
LPRLKDGGPYINAVSPEYFTTMGMRLVRGRAFAPTDVKGAAPVAVINETMARFYFAGREALGSCLYLGDAKTAAPCVTIVGIVHDTRRQSIRDVLSAQYFVVDAQDVWQGPDDRLLMLRASGAPGETTTAVAHAMQGLAPGLPYASVVLLRDLVEPQIRPWRLGASLFVVFGGIALIVAAVGLYSVVSFDTAQRAHEVGVRMALGARARQILSLVVADGVRSAAIGIVLGLAIAIAAGRAVASLLFNVSPRDPLALGGAALALLVVAVLASVAPAWRATRIPPSQALRTG